MTLNQVYSWGYTRGLNRKQTALEVGFSSRAMRYWKKSGIPINSQFRIAAKTGLKVG